MKNVSQFIPILEQLDIIHTQEYLHSDIQEVNIVFSDDDDRKAWIIDFDLVERENTPYPDNFNCQRSI